jgi:hypothetical protein
MRLGDPAGRVLGTPYSITWRVLGTPYSITARELGMLSPELPAVVDRINDARSESDFRGMY